jgi:hypothetical protein
MAQVLSPPVGGVGEGSHTSGRRLVQGGTLPLPPFPPLLFFRSPPFALPPLSRLLLRPVDSWLCSALPWVLLHLL